MAAEGMSFHITPWVTIVKYSGRRLINSLAVCFHLSD
jgi:hypothetical protein